MGEISAARMTMLAGSEEEEEDVDVEGGDDLRRALTTSLTPRLRVLVRAAGGGVGFVSFWKEGYLDDDEIEGGGEGNG